MARIAYDTVEYNAFGPVTVPRPTLGFDYNGGLEKAFEVWGIPDTTVPPLSFTASAVNKTTVDVTFARPVVNSYDLVNSDNYSIAPPVGAPSLIVTSVTKVSSAAVRLVCSGDTVNGGVYTISIAAVTAIALDNMATNSTQGQTYAGISDLPYVTSAYADGNQSVEVFFSKPVRMVSPSNTDDALRPTNYSIPSLTVRSVVGRSSSSVQLITDVQQVTTYTLTLANIKDIAGNVVVP